MAANLPTILVLSLILILFHPTANADVGGHGGLQVANETLEWQYQNHFNLEPEFVEEQELEDEEGLQRRSLYWRSPRRRKYYISYGALSANRVPCPPRSGRSYYTHNCYRARGPVHPYTRGCSAITRCRR